MTRAWRILQTFAAVLALACAGCTSPAESGNQSDDSSAGDAADTTGDDRASRIERLQAVDDWAYQLQGSPLLDLAPIEESAFDLVVIDYAADGSAETEFTAAQIDNVKSRPGSDRLVLAYMSIGEAEIGRFYFNSAWITPDPESFPDGPFSLTAAAPAFLVEPNPDFPDNFKVRYFDTVWQELIIANPGHHPIIGDAPSYLDRVIDAGFDGVYLDIIDAFEFFGPEELGGTGERPDAAGEMIDFVIAIAQHSRKTRGQPDFLVFPQNGSGIIEVDAYPAEILSPGVTAEEFAAARRNDYFGVIDGIGAEDSFYFGDADEDNPLDPQAETIARLDDFRNAGLVVLAVDYLTDSSAVDDFYERARHRGWIPYATTRDLSRLTVHPTRPPDER